MCTEVVGACDEPTDALGNSGRTGDFILRGHFQLRQVGEVRSTGREPLQTALRAMCAVPGEVIGDVGAGRADAVVGLQGRCARTSRCAAGAGRTRCPSMRRARPSTACSLQPAASTTAVNSSAVNWLPWPVLTIPGAPYLGQGQLDHLLGMDRLQRNGQPMRQHAAARHVHHGRAVYEAGAPSGCGSCPAPRPGWPGWPG